MSEHWLVCYKAAPLGDCFRQTYWFPFEGTYAEAEKAFHDMNTAKESWGTFSRGFVLQHIVPALER